MYKSIIKYLNLFYKVDFKNTKLRKLSNNEFIFFDELNEELNQIFDINEAVTKKILIDWINSRKKKPTVRFNYRKYWETKNSNLWYHSVNLDYMNIYPNAVFNHRTYDNDFFNRIMATWVDEAMSQREVGRALHEELTRTIRPTCSVRYIDSLGIPVVEYPVQERDYNQTINQLSEYYNAICLEEPK